MQTPDLQTPVFSINNWPFEKTSAFLKFPCFPLSISELTKKCFLLSNFCCELSSLTSSTRCKTILFHSISFFASWVLCLCTGKKYKLAKSMPPGRHIFWPSWAAFFWIWKHRSAYNLMIKLKYGYNAMFRVDIFSESFNIYSCSLCSSFFTS